MTDKRPEEAEMLSFQEKGTEIYQGDESLRELRAEETDFRARTIMSETLPFD